MISNRRQRAVPPADSDPTPASSEAGHGLAMARLWTKVKNELAAAESRLSQTGERGRLELHVYPGRPPIATLQATGGKQVLDAMETERVFRRRQSINDICARLSANPPDVLPPEGQFVTLGLLQYDGERPQLRAQVLEGSLENPVVVKPIFYADVAASFVADREELAAAEPDGTSEWDAARHVRCIRNEPTIVEWAPGKPYRIEPGMVYFVELLHQAGCSTSYSCEGHPGGAYLTFDAPPAVQQALLRSPGIGRLADLMTRPGGPTSLHVRGTPANRSERNETLRELAHELRGALAPLLTHDVEPGPQRVP